MCRDCLGPPPGTAGRPRYRPLWRTGAASGGRGNVTWGERGRGEKVKRGEKSKEGGKKILKREKNNWKRQRRGKSEKRGKNEEGEKNFKERKK